MKPELGGVVPILKAVGDWCRTEPDAGSTGDWCRRDADVRAQGDWCGTGRQSSVPGDLGALAGPVSRRRGRSR